MSSKLPEGTTITIPFLDLHESEEPVGFPKDPHRKEGIYLRTRPAMPFTATAPIYAAPATTIMVAPAGKSGP